MHIHYMGNKMQVQQNTMYSQVSGQTSRRAANNTVFYFVSIYDDETRYAVVSNAAFSLF